MNRTPDRSRGTARGSGFALIPALFLMVVLALLAVVAVRLGSTQQQTVMMGLQEARALAAARAGIEWGAYQALNGGCPAASSTLSLTEASLSGFSVVVTCTSTAFSNGTGSSTSFVVNATATSGTYGRPSYVKRVVSGTFEKDG